MKRKWDFRMPQRADNQGRIQQESQIEYRKTEGRIKRVTRSRQRSKMPEHY
ncbi:hypothetical protein LEMLEM_LOCUS15544 [Lemmus lemmus]